MNLTFTGPTEVQRKLTAAEKKIRTKATRGVVNEQSKIVLRLAKAAAPVAKKDYGPGGSTKKSLGRKVKVFRRGEVGWFGVGGRSQWVRTVAKKFRYWRDKQGRMRKAPIAWSRKEQPSRRMHLTDRQSGFLRRTAQAARAQLVEAGRKQFVDAVRG